MKRMTRHKQDKYGPSTLKQRLKTGADHDIDKEREEKEKKEKEQVSEGKKGLWDNIHAKRKRGEKPAKPGDKDYPKTLNVESIFNRLKESRKPEVEEKGRKVAELEREGRAKGITDKFRKEHPGSREEKKERGRKPTEGELNQERIKKHNERVRKHGFTSKEKKESDARAKYDSARD
jgi:hypothetical protein